MTRPISSSLIHGRTKLAVFPRAPFCWHTTRMRKTSPRHSCCAFSARHHYPPIAMSLARWWNTTRTISRRRARRISSINTLGTSSVFRDWTAACLAPSIRKRTLPVSGQISKTFTALIITGSSNLIRQSWRRSSIFAKVQLCPEGPPTSASDVFATVLAVASKQERWTFRCT